MLSPLRSAGTLSRRQCVIFVVNYHEYHELFVVKMLSESDLPRIRGKIIRGKIFGEGRYLVKGRESRGKGRRRNERRGKEKRRKERERG